MARLRPGGILATLALLVASCGAGSIDGRETVTVFAAASLTDVMTDLVESYEREHDGWAVSLSFGPSSGLREQILDGAPADVFAAADRSHAEALAESGAIEEVDAFARTGLAIAVPAGNPAGVTGLRDLARPELLVGLCAAEVPCGAYARRALAAAGVEPSLDTEAGDVRALLTQLASGDLDAGIVYETDVRSAGGEVEGIDLPAEVNPTVEYVLGTVVRPDVSPGAAQFVRYVGSGGGAAILAEHGFETA